MALVGEEFYIDARGIKARGVVTENGFRVCKGSQVREKIASYLNPSLKELRKKSSEDGTIVDGYLSRDMEFKSPSTAAYFLFGANASGPQTWQDENGMTMLEHDKLAAGVLKDPSDREYLGFLKTVEGNEGSKCHYPTRLDTYGCGCGHDCSYCYAKDMIINLSGPNGWDPQHPKIADLWRIENRIKRGELKRGDIVRLGGLTDCFQPVELKYRTTLETIKILNKYDIGYLIVTKSHFVANDEYIEVMRKDLAHIQVTTTTFDPELCARYEKASLPNKRVEAIERLQSLGYDTFFRLSPYVDGWIDFEKLNNVACDKILVEFLRANSTIAKRFGCDLNDFPVKDATYSHMSLEHKLDVLSRITGFKEVTVCDDCTEHYEYFRDHFNPNPDDCCNLRK